MVCTSLRVDCPVKICKIIAFPLAIFAKFKGLMAETAVRTIFCHINIITALKRNIFILTCNCCIGFVPCGCGKVPLYTIHCTDCIIYVLPVSHAIKRRVLTNPSINSGNSCANVLLIQGFSYAYSQASGKI